MDCSCDYEPAEFTAEKWVKARKPHRCYECGSTIDPSEKYLRIASKYDDEIQTFRWCETCEKAFRELIPVGACVRYGELWEYLGL